MPGGLERAAAARCAVRLPCEGSAAVARALRKRRLHWPFVAARLRVARLSSCCAAKSRAASPVADSAAAAAADTKSGNFRSVGGSGSCAMGGARSLLVER